MKIAMLVTEFPKVTETFTLREATELRRMGHEVRILHLTRFRRNEVIHDFARPLVEDSHGLPYLLAPRVLRTLLRSPGETAAIAGALTRGFARKPALLAKSLAIVPKSLAFARDLESWGADHVHASFAGHPATSAWIIHKACGLPYSISCHAHDIFRDQSFLAEKFRAAAFVRTISQYNADFLQRQLGEEACRRLHVIHCGVRVQPGPVRQADRRMERILFVGALEPKKGVAVLLRALSRLGLDRPWQARIVGGGGLRASLEQLSSSLGLGNRVTFLGPQPAEAVAAELRQADLLVAPSVPGPSGRAEGIPTVLMEAMSHELPVVASRLTGIPELVQDGETGLLFDPGRDDQLAEAVMRLQADPCLARSLGTKGLDLVRREFEIGRNVERLLALMEMSRSRHAEGAE